MRVLPLQTWLSKSILFAVPCTLLTSKPSDCTEHLTVHPSLREKGPTKTWTNFAYLVDIPPDFGPPILPQGRKTGGIYIGGISMYD